MENTIHINRLEVHANHGVFEPEKELGQRFYINAVLHLDFQDAINSDNLDNTVHYGFVSESIIDYFKNNRCDLIETITHQLIVMLFEKYRLINKIELEVVKPWAPLTFSFEAVSTKVVETRSTAYIALGGNIGSSEQLFEDAISKISNLQGVYTVKRSKQYRSKPFGGVEQADFLNMAIAVETNIHPRRLLDMLQAIELELGRTREVHWGPRTIDLDIILYDDMLINTDRLLIPHRYMTKRDFVLKPLLDLNQYLVDPRTNQPLIDSYEGLTETYIEEL